MREKLLDHVSFVPQANDEFIESEKRVGFHDMPEDWLRPDFNHGLGLCLRLLADARAKTSGQNYYLHKGPFRKEIKGLKYLFLKLARVFFSVCRGIIVFGLQPDDADYYRFRTVLAWMFCLNPGPILFFREQETIAMSEMRRAFFLDRDGVINKDTHYPHKPEHITFMPGIFEFCKRISDLGYIIVVVTNQAGIAKGKFTEDDVKHLHAWMGQQFCKHGIAIAGFYYCPYHKDGIVEKFRKDSDLRKPKPGMFLQAEKDLGIDLMRSVMVGDKDSDRIELAGLRSIIIKGEYKNSGYDAASLDEVIDLLRD
jgi:D-glycero-D-manno-heptose 1,7-bisphosphate phosphatase